MIQSGAAASAAHWSRQPCKAGSVQPLRQWVKSAADQKNIIRVIRSSRPMNAGYQSIAYAKGS